MTHLTQGSGATRQWLALLVAGGALALAGCSGKSDNETAGQKLDSAIQKTEKAGSDAKAKTEQMASDAKAKVESSDAKESVKDAGAKVAGAVDDAAITAKVSAGLAKDPDLSAIKIDVDTKGGIVSLNGPAPTAAAKMRAEEIAKAVDGVSAVQNHLQVKAM